MYSKQNELLLWSVVGDCDYVNTKRCQIWVTLFGSQKLCDPTSISASCTYMHVILFHLEINLLEICIFKSGHHSSFVDKQGTDTAKKTSEG